MNPQDVLLLIGVILFVANVAVCFHPQNKIVPFNAAVATLIGGTIIATMVCT